MPVEVKGAIELRKALRAYAPDLSKQLTKEMGAALKPITRKARSYMPTNDQTLSNWVGTLGRDQGRFPQYDASVAKKGITYKTSPSKANKRGFRSLATIFNKTAAGAIFETAGRVTPNSTFAQNVQFKSGSQLKGTDKNRGRAIFRAWNEDNGKALTGVMRAIEKATASFQVRTKV